MLKYSTLVFLILFAVSCKKETVAPVTPPPPTDTTATAAVFSLLDAAGNCNAILVEGSYTTGVALTAANRIVLQVNVTTPGTYTISAGGGNGYRFSASGTFAAAGVQQLILPGRGTPALATINNYSIASGSSSCSFTIAVLRPPVILYDDNDHMYFGNLSNAAPIVDSANNYLMRKPYYATSYSNDMGKPNWVSWHLFANDLGTTPRQDDFREDISLPAGWYQVTDASYNGAGFDRGHNTPSGDRTSSIEANSSTFLMTNMIPQAPYNNQIVWAAMEDSLRRLATLGYEVYIIMGNYGVGGTGNNGYASSIDAGRVTVPSNIWKVAVVIPNGNNDSSRVDVNTRIIAVDIPNTNTLFSNWKNYRVSVDAIEAATGYDLLTRLPEILQADVEIKVDNL